MYSDTAGWWVAGKSLSLATFSAIIWFELGDMRARVARARLEHTAFATNIRGDE